MADLRVTVRYNDAVIEDRTVAVRGAVKLGDGADAAVSFPGASVTVCRVGGHLDIRGRRLAPGEATSFSLGPVHVALEHVESIALRPRPTPPLDPRFLMVVMGVTVAGMWLELGAELIKHPPSAVVRVERRAPSEAASRHARDRVAAVRPSEPSAPPAATPVAAEGREARNDDDDTRWGYYRWYRQVVPADLEAEVARYRLAKSPADPVQRALVARGAYEADSFREALGHYRVLTDLEPQSVSWWMGLATCQKRLGMHRAELKTWERVLELDADNLIAQGNRAVALARVGEYVSAEQALERLRPHLAGSPYLNVYVALYDAIRGREQQAVSALEEVLVAREELPEALQIELRRDLAIDPVLRPLRSNAQLRAMLYRQLGAAAPRPLR